MDKRILIVTKLNDEHAHLVATGLDLMGVRSDTFRFGMMPMYESHTLELDGSIMFRVNNDIIFGEDVSYDRIWLRRIGGSSIKLMNIQENDKRYVYDVMNAYRTSLFALINRLSADRPDIMINGYWAKLAAESKMLQLWQARRAGLTVPETIQSNDVSAIRTFQEKHSGKIICKAIIPQMWQSERRLAFAYTAILPNVDSIPPEAISLHPAIYQPYVDKLFEIRIVIFGGKQFGIKIDSQDDQLSVVDWRAKRLIRNNNENYRLPEDIFNKCINLMRSLDISYGAFDFIVSPNGDYIFLEVNEAGQFLFIEDCGPNDKIAHAFCHFLIHGTLQDWSEKNVTFTLKDLLFSEQAKERKEADAQFRDYDRTARVSQLDDTVGSHYVGNVS